MKLFLGVDGGGTKTDFVCIDETGCVVARAMTGTTYHLQVGLKKAIGRLAEGIDMVAEQLGVSPHKFSYVFFGLPAFGEDATIDPQLEAACVRLVGHDRVRCGNDMVCGWAGSLGCADGINLVAGTGSIAYGERQGHKARAGGWGEVFSDEGSAYWIAIQGLQVFTKMSDGRLPSGLLRQGIAGHFGLVTDIDICARVMGEDGMSREEIAGLAPVVARAAEDGDIHAAAILNQAGAELAGMADALRKRLGFGDEETVILSWSGGVLTKQRAVRDSLRLNLQHSDKYELIAPLYEPGIGAALYASFLAGRTRDQPNLAL